MPKERCLHHAEQELASARRKKREIGRSLKRAQEQFRCRERTLFLQIVDLRDCISRLQTEIKSGHLPIRSPIRSRRPVFVQEIFERFLSGETQRSIARSVGRHVTTVRRIIQNEFRRRYPELVVKRCMFGGIGLLTFLRSQGITSARLQNADRNR